MVSSWILHDQGYTTIISVNLGFVDSGHSSGLPQVIFTHLYGLPFSKISQFL